MAIVVSLRDLVDELQTLSDESHVYLNKVTGKVITITNDDFAMAENDDESEDESDNDWGEYSDLEIDFFQEVKKVLSLDDDYLKLPSKFDIDEYEMMERFCLSIPNEKISNVFLDMIRGSGAFRRFKDLIYRYDIEKDWFKFRDEAYKDFAISWLESNGFAYTDDMNRRAQSS
ncbi:MAG: UPF0158 family protein [Chloroflexi bacterium]|nr:UPF0158 family protein [Chloroflexota bacterium]